MGGRSSSKQSTSNQQSTANIVNDGDYAGVSGDVTHDESSVDINDSYNTDNSTDTKITIDEDYDYSQDNRVDIEDSYNTDNSINLDDGSIFANGDISFVDAGAVRAAQEIAEASLAAVTAANAKASALSASALESNERTTRNALDANERTVGRALNTAEFAIDEIEDVATSSVKQVGDTSAEIITELTNASSDFASNLSSAAQANFAINEKALASVSTSNTNDKGIIAELARNTSLAGQDIVAKSSEKMTMYMAIAAAIGFIAISFISVKG